MIVVCDSNVYISALVFGGLPRRILSLAGRGRIHLLVSGALISEVEAVLERKFGWETRHVRRFCNPLWEAAKCIQPTSRIAACRDPNDNHLVALAVEGCADFVISGDRDLLVLHPFQGVQIKNPAEFLESTQFE